MKLYIYNTVELLRRRLLHFQHIIFIGALFITKLLAHLRDGKSKLPNTKQAIQSR